MQLFDHMIHHGEKAFFTLPVGETAYRSLIEIPVIAVCGQEEGPTLWVNGTVHGDELNGSWAGWELARELDPKGMKGNLIVTPLSNPFAYADRRKVSTVDDLDMDTIFPGSSSGMLPQRIADLLYQAIRSHASALINFHTMATPYRANPYSVRKIVPGVSEEVNRMAEQMQRAFGTHANCVVDLRGSTNELPGVTSGALDITCLKDGIPAFMGEMGQGGVIERSYVDVAKGGIANVMRLLGILEGEVQHAEGQIRITNRRFLRCDRGGLIQLSARPGDIVKAGQELFTQHYYGQEIESFCVEQDSYIIGARSNPVVNTGDRIAFVGTQWAPWEA